MRTPKTTQGRLGQGSLEERLLADMLNDRDYRVRLNAAINLAKIATPGKAEIIDAYFRALGDAHETVRTVAAGALTRLVDNLNPKDPQDVSLIRQALLYLSESATQDPSKMVQAEAKRAFGVLRSRYPKVSLLHVPPGPPDSTDADPAAADQPPATTARRGHRTGAAVFLAILGVSLFVGGLWFFSTHASPYGGRR